MGSAVKSATSAVTDAFDQAKNNFQDATTRGFREELNRAAGVFMPTAYLGNAMAVAAKDNGGDLTTAAQNMAADLGMVAPSQPSSVPVDAGMTQAPDAPSLADPERKRQRQADGRAGTILTGGNPGQGGTTLGGPGNRSTLLGL